MANPIIAKTVLDWEDIAGADPSSPKPIILQATESGITVNRQTKTDDIIGGDIDSGGEPYGTFNEVQGNLVTPMYFEQMGVLLKALLGQPTTVLYGTNWSSGTAVNVDDLIISTTNGNLMLRVTTAGTTDSNSDNEPDISSANIGDTVIDNDVEYVVINNIYKHTYLSNRCIPSFLVQNTLKNDCDGGGDLIERYNGCKAKSGQISISPDGDYNFTIDVVGMKFRDSLTDDIIELNEDNSIEFSNTRIKNVHAKLKVDGNYYTLSKEFSLTIDRGTEAIYTIGTGANAGEIVDSNITVNGNFASLFDENIYRKAKQESEASFMVEIKSDLLQLNAYVNQAKFSFKNEGKKVKEKYPLNLDWTAYRTGASDAKIKFELFNNIKEY